jgi:hypothetical protein
MIPIFRLSLFCFAVLLWTSPRSAVAQRTSTPSDANYARIESVQDVIELWDNQRRLFVKGDLAVSEQSLADLAIWLATHGPHWTVVLMDDADGQAFTAPDRRVYFGMDAVEFALGKGLTNRTAFGQLHHPSTGETDGAIFVLFLKERKFSYFSSEAQDRRGLGRSHWIGELDQPALRAMRGGGRIVDAVKDTVKSINQRLDRAIQEEKESARQAELERLRDLQAARESMIHVKELIEQVIAERVRLRERQRDARGELANPPVEEWSEQLARIEDGLSENNAGQAQPQLKQLATQIDAYLYGYAALEGYGPNRSDLERAIAELSTAPNRVTADSIQQLQKILSESDDKARNGDLALTETLRQAEEKIAQGRKLQFEEEVRLEQQRARQRLIRQILVGVAGALSLLLVGVLIAFNRLRKPTRDRALEMLKSRESTVAKETDGLDQLFSRSADLLGSRDRIDQRGYTGTTRAMGLQALGDIDDLLIMNKEIRRVILMSRSLIEPKGLWNSILNRFSREPFDQSIQKLSGAPLTFSRATGIPIVLMDIVRQKAKEQGQPEPTEIPDEVVLTFDEIYQAIQARRQRAVQTIEKLEHSLMNVNDELNRLQTELQKALDQDTRLSNASDGDGLFALPNYFDILIPSAQQDIQEADALSASDAVAAIDGPIQKGSRKLKEASELASCIEEFRLQGLPEMISLAEKLRGLNYPTSWMDGEWNHRSQWANALMEKGAKESIASEMAQWKESIELLLASSRQAWDLAQRIHDTTAPRLALLKDEIHRARQELGERHQLPPERMLVEPNFNPDDFLAAAHRSLDAASTMLKQGRVHACIEALDGCDAAVEQAVATIESSQQSSREFDSRKGEQEERLQHATTRFDNLWEQIRKAEQEYSEDSLRLAYSTPALPKTDTEEPTAEPSLEREGQRAPQLLDRARDRASACSSILTNAQDMYRQGMLLSSMGKVQEATSMIAQMNIRLDRVADHLERLESTVVENQKGWAASIDAVKRLVDAQRDRMVTLPTLDQIQALANHVGQIQQNHTSPQARTNPFEFAQTLHSTQKRIAELEAMIISDRHGYAEAQRALEGAVQQWQVANQFVKQSRSDNIPDSPATSEGVRRIESLERNLLNVQQDFAKDHGDWRSISSRSASIQSDLATVSRQLNTELQQANATLEAFQQASQMVYDAEHWTGQWGIRVDGSPGVRTLEAARASLQRGQYPAALDASRRAYSEAHTEIQRAERKVAARRMEIQQAEERKRRERMAAESTRYGGVTIGPSIGSGPSIFGPGSFGGGGFGGGGSRGGGSSSGRSSSDDSSGFSRSGW